MSALVVLADPVASTGGGETLLFWVGSAICVAGALGLIFAKKAVHSALCLCAVMICLALFYMAQGAIFLGVVQIVVYTGAIMMLFLFVLMLIGIDHTEVLAENIRGQRWAAVVLAVAFGAIMLGVLAHAHLGVFKGVDAANGQYGGNVPSLANLLFSRYYWAFEVSSAVLITSALGAMVLAHRERVHARKTQRELSEDRFKRFDRDPSTIVTPMPSPGVFAQHNGVDTPALLPDGSISELSVNATLRNRGMLRGIRPLAVPLPRADHPQGNGHSNGHSNGHHGDGSANGAAQDRPGQSEREEIQA
ncbi:MAG TPA: NADH-quinone oxidoreductase subunit J [Actinocrinis sp.]|nr:NADH-quinone oxidoreductase subunit J [Actinocrinis sp.]